MATSLNKIFVNVSDSKVSSFLAKVKGTAAVLYTYEEYKALDGKSETTAEAFAALTDAQKTKTAAVAADASTISKYSSKIVFLGSSGQIYTQGNVYGVDSSDYAALKAAVDTLIGTDTGKSARTIAAEEVAKVVDGANSAFDTLKEIAEWIAGSDGEVAKTAEEIITAVGDPATYYTESDTLPEGKSVGDVKKEATGLYALITKSITDLDVSDNVSDESYGIKVEVDEVDGKVQKPVVTVTPVALGTAVGMKQVVAGDLTTIGEGDAAKTYLSSTLTDGAATASSVEAKVGDYIAADGTITTDGVVSATDVAAEIVADEKVIATALNDHETRIKAVENLTGASKAVVTFTEATAGSGEEGDEGYVAPTAATISVDDTDATLTGAAIAEIKSYVDAQDHDHSETTVEEDEDNSEYLVIAGGKTTGTNDYTYTVKLTEAGYTASSSSSVSFTTEGVVTSEVLGSVLGDLWETYTAE